MAATTSFITLVEQYKKLAQGGNLTTRMIYQKLYYWKGDLTLVQRINIVDFLHHLEGLEQSETIVTAIKSFKEYLAATGEN